MTLPITNKEVKDACEASYATFCRIMQEDGWFDPQHEKLCNFIQEEIEAALREDRDVKIVVVMPRGSLKSTIITKYFPIWMTLKDSNMRTLVATNTQPNARKKLQDIRSLFEVNQLFQNLWPNLQPTKESKWTDELVRLPRTGSFPEGTFESCGMKTKKVGAHYNIIIEDDTTAPDQSDVTEEAVLPSKETIEQVIGWHKLATPLMVPKGIRIRLVVSTRWGDYDLVSYVETNEKYKIFDIPAVDEQTGEPNFTMFYTKEKLKEIEDQLGPYMFSCLYLNKPIDASLRVFQDQWIQYVSLSEVPQEGYFTVAIDPAISQRDQSCETAITVVKHVRDSSGKVWMYWIKDVHGHMLPNKSIEEIFGLVERYFPFVRAIIVETVAYQMALKYALLDEMIKRKMNIGVLEFKGGHASKDERIQALQPYFAAGRIKLVRGLTPQTESQLRQFPHGKLKDVIDSFSMHMMEHQGERMMETPTGTPRKNPYSWESVMEEVMKKSAGQRGGVLAYLGEQNNVGIDPRRDMHRLFEQKQ